ncbi:MAG TPA: SemiSWEET family transporter [Gemmatimonadaceae bacterium]|nr:SemiSWEET family transporter [Gemmatimonadaceae bacterium]
MTPVDAAAIVGTASGFITVSSFVPQVWRVWRTKRTRDLSLGTCALLVIQSAGWTTYGLLLGQPPIIWTNTCVLLLTLIILGAKVRHG